MLSKAFVCAVASLAFSTSVHAQLTTTNQNDPDVLAEEILGYGIAIVPGSANFMGWPPIPTADDPTAKHTAGLFSGGLAAGIGIESGIILSTGAIQSAVAPNLCDNTMSMWEWLTGDADLDALIPPGDPLTKEATALEFQFTTESGNVSFNFVFASDEYNEYIDTGVSDIVAFFVDGENIAMVPGTDIPVSIDNVNGGGGDFDRIPYGTGGDFEEFYNNNDPRVDSDPDVYDPVLDDPCRSAVAPFAIEYDGFTDVFVAQAMDLEDGIHTLKIAISDVGDKQVDSAVFIEAESLTDEPEAETISCNCETPGAFDPPLDKNVTVKKGNRVIPLKMDLCAADGTYLTDLDILPPMAEVDWLEHNGSSDFEADEFLSTGHGDDGNLFVYSGSKWELNLQTKMFEAEGIYRITTVSTDPDYVIDPACSVDFIIE